MPKTRCYDLAWFSRWFGFSGRSLALLASLGLIFSVAVGTAHAQASNDLINNLRQTLQNQSDSTPSAPPSQSQDKTLVLQPDFAHTVKKPPSRLERIMSAKAGTSLHQFGYDQFGTGRPVSVPQVGAIQDDYVLGPGDEIVVALRGQENAEYRVRVDRSGRVALPRINPVAAAGRTLGDFRQDVEAAVSRAYISTQAFISIGSLRQIQVMVSGDVRNPGMRLVTGLSTPIDAILLSGGVKKSGSLRSIKLVHDGKQTTVDLYDLLTQNRAGRSALLADGDRIIVPPLGKTVAAVGWVRRPGIYELPAGATGVSVQGLLTLAGGLEVRGRYRISVLRVAADGTSKMQALSGRSGTVRDSEVLYALPGAQQTEQQAVLSGSTPLAGQYSVGGHATLADILKLPGALGPSPYTLFGVISRRNPQTLMRTMLPFTPTAVLRGTENMDLNGKDVVRVISTKEARLLLAVIEAYRKRRDEAEGALRAPNMVTEKKLEKNLANPNSGSDNSDQQQALQSNQQQRQNHKSKAPNTEREDIAELSDLKLSDGGILDEQSEQDKQQLRNRQFLQTQRNQNPYSQGNFPSKEDQAGNTQQYYEPKPATPALNLQEQDVSQGQVATNQEAQTFGEFAKQLDVDPLVLIHFLMGNEVTINGAVHGPGAYLVGPHATLQDVVDAAGGTAGWADKSGVELTTTTVSGEMGTAHTQRQLLSLRANNLSSYIVKPHDEIRFNQVYTSVGEGSVTIQGDVRSPGKYKIERGERLSELLLRAGGLTDEAYPYGTVFLRKSAAAIELAGYQRTADEMQNMMIAGLTRIGSEKTSPAAFTAMQSFVTELRNTKPLGRVSFIADPVLLAHDRSQDPLLEDGDVIYIPQRPSTVTVLGQVMQPGSFQFSSKMSVKDYVERAGGYGQFADKSLTFLVLPDGTARPVEVSWFDLSSPDIPPGSTIVVPRDLSPIDFRQILLDASSLLSSLAVSAASLAVITR